MNFSLDGKVAIVTGAAGLLGKSTCTALAESGATVVAVDQDEQAVASIAEAYPSGRALPMDVTQPDSIERVREIVLQEFGRLDIVVNNAAINDKFEDPSASMTLSQFDHYPLEAFRKMLEVNVLGVFNCCQILGRPMVQQKRGSLINIASTYGVVAPDQRLYINEQGEQEFYKSPGYPTSKAAVLHLTRHIASCWGNLGVRANCLSPGGIQNGQDPFFVKSYSQKTPLGRMAETRDMWGALIYLASDASQYVTGSNLVVDGGFTIW